MTKERIWHMSSNPKFHMMGPDGKTTLCGKTLKFTSIAWPESQIGYSLNRTTFCVTCKAKVGKNADTATL